LSVSFTAPRMSESSADRAGHQPRPRGLNDALNPRLCQWAAAAGPGASGACLPRWVRPHWDA